MIELTQKDISTINRMLGQIEGVAYGMGDNGMLVSHAIEVIDEILNKVEAEK